MLLLNRLPLLGVVLGTVAGLHAPPALAVDVVKEKELFITNLNVVNHPTEALDPAGPFHIRTLLEAMAPAGGSAKDVLLSLVRGFRTDSPDLPPRNIDQMVIDPWKRWAPDGMLLPASGIPSDDDWVVNWQKAPFRLMAIVNRIDLRLNPTIRQAGEGRFVFCITDPLNPEDGSPLSFTVILEYLQPAANQVQVLAVAKGWHALGAIPGFNQAYIDQLKVVTHKFAGRNAMPGRPNGSALGQLRTNEIALNTGSGWELREFVLDAPTGLLRPDTTKLTPHHGLNETETLGFLIKTLGEDAVGSFPAALIGFRGIPGGDPGFRWNAPDVDSTNTILRRISVNSCSGCHGGDGHGRVFVHTSLREKTDETQLSEFLNGVPAGMPGVTNPVTGLEDPNFNDLEARKVDFQNLVDPSVAPFTNFEAATDFVRAEREFETSRTVRVH